MEVYTKKREQVLEELNVDQEKGLTSGQVEEHSKKYGVNEFAKAEKITMFRRIIDSLKEPLTIMLIFAGFIAIAVNVFQAMNGSETDVLEVVGIFIAISLSVIITVLMEGKSAKAFEALNKLNEDIRVKAIRDGKIQMLLKKDIVVGDVIFLETGDKIPADGRLIKSIELQVNESSLTGESEPVEKDAEIEILDAKPVAERINMVYSGCFVTSGSGTIVVTSVGDSTEFGQIAKELSSHNSTSTPLQEKIGQMGKKIAILGSVAALIIFIMQVVIFVNNGTASVDTIAEAFITSIVLLVASVPEGLPTIVAVSLAINVIKMSKQNCLVKKMVACETMGCINIICSDKTGTLTKNQMTVAKIFDTNKIIEIKDLSNENLISNFALNSNANIKTDGSAIEFIGNPTECAILSKLHEMGIDYDGLRKQAQVEHVYPFSSETKVMTTVLKDNNHMLYTKGAPERVMTMCDIDHARRQSIEEEIIRLQEQSFRIIAFAHKELNISVDYEADREKVESNLIYDGFVAISDPLRDDVLEAVEKCKLAGIELKMLTGDNRVTATAIANELKILEGNCRVVEACELEGLSDEELVKVLPEIRVIARSTPNIKMRIVNALKSQGNVVAVTGDGINDAPAIKNADVGIAMGIAGTEVSKEASDIVLLDDSFATIVNGIKWGRGIYENFQRFIQFQLTVNFASVITVMMSIIAGFKTPFTALQLLWINIIMDGPPALTLGVEPVREDIMEHKPTKRDASIVSRDMFRRIIINGIFITSVFLSQTVFNFLGGTAEQGSTILFTLFVVFTLFNAFNCRELGKGSILKNFAKNKLMLIVFACVFSLQVLIIQFAGAFFGTVPLPFMMWVKIVGLASTIIVFSEIVKLIERLIFKK